MELRPNMSVWDNNVCTYALDSNLQPTDLPMTTNPMYNPKRAPQQPADGTAVTIDNVEEGIAAQSAPGSDHATPAPSAPDSHTAAEKAADDVPLDAHADVDDVTPVVACGGDAVVDDVKPALARHDSKPSASRGLLHAKAPGAINTALPVSSSGAGASGGCDSGLDSTPVKESGMFVLPSPTLRAAMQRSKSTPRAAPTRLMSAQGSNESDGAKQQQQPEAQARLRQFPSSRTAIPMATPTASAECDVLPGGINAV